MVELIAPVVDLNISLLIVTLGIFFVAAFMEIGRGYLVWQWIREKKGILIGLTGGINFVPIWYNFLYGIIPTLQPSHFGRTYAAYGGIFIISSII